MSLAKKHDCDVVILVRRRRLMVFHRGRRLQPFFAQPPCWNLLENARAVARGAVIIAGDCALALPPHSRADRRPIELRHPTGLGLSARVARRLKSPRVLVVEASAAFVERDTLAALVAGLGRFDLVGIRESGSALAVSRKLFLRAVRARPRLFDRDLWQVFRALGGTAEGMVLPPAAVHEQPLTSAMAAYRALTQQRLAAAGRLVSQGLGLRDPGSFDLRGRLKFGRGITIDSNAILLGKMVLGDGVSIGRNCILEDSRIGAGTEIKDFTSVSGATLGRNCRVGPYARVRPGSGLGNGCHLGNFVEIKTSKLGESCKINHHSFIGDATIGRNVIIGAGAITCNYDGWRTQATVIRDNVFVGSGVMMVAPLTVGKNAFVGAGSTVTKAVPGGGLTLARGKQLTLKGWKKRKNTQRQ